MSKRLLRSLLSLMVCMAMLLSLAPAALAESGNDCHTDAFNQFIQRADHL